LEDGEIELTRSIRKPLIELWLSVFVLMVAGAQCASESTQIYANLPTQIDISIPEELKDLQLQNCVPSQTASAEGGVEIKSNVDWSLTVSADTASGHMVGSTGSPPHELSSPMDIQSLAPSGGPVAIPGTVSDPSAVSLLSGISPGDYSGEDIIALLFEQPFEWGDYGNEDYGLVVTFTVGPA
jgi:hypothetical protein